MIQYSISLYQASRHRIQVKVVIPTPEKETILKISAWRPGRYEEGNFSRLISHVQAFNNNKRVAIEKISKNEWLANTADASEIQLTYLYYGAELTAGNTYLDENILLINPVNLLIYSDLIFNEEISLSIDLQKDWSVVGLEHKPENNTLFSSMDEAFDTPILAGKEIKTTTYSHQNHQFYIHQHSSFPIAEDRLISDFFSFTKAQVDAFGEFPVKIFSFILIGVHERYLHGVEHLNSTVIVLGPEEEWGTSRYEALLGVSSHELYHVWNIKTIRPASMLPYRFHTQNYSRLGYIYEGITTFMGDYYLLKSGVISSARYLEILQEQIQIHVDNPGRHSYSIGDSSIDTWVDGYVTGTPGRKVSIYNEGALLAFVIDAKIRKATKNKCNLEGFMRRMYYEFGIHSKGYNEAEVKRLLMECSGIDFSEFFDQYVNAAQGYESILKDALNDYGIVIEQVVPSDRLMAELGIKVLLINQKTIITGIAAGSPSDLGGLCEGDQIKAINSIEILNDIAKQVQGIESELNQVSIMRKGKEITLSLPLVQRTYFPRVILKKLDTKDQAHLKNRAQFGF